MEPFFSPRRRLSKGVTLSLALTLAVGLTGCQTETPASPSPRPTPSPTAEKDPSAARTAYAAVLRDLLQHLTLPDGTQLSQEDILAEDLSANTFALSDVDGDGREELVVLFSTTYTAAMQGAILDYDMERGDTYLELLQFPSFTFYSNGYLKVYASHNQTDGAMWPYTLYQYDPETDTYKEVAAMVYACDKEILESFGREADYPQEADRSGIGTVYYVDSTVPLDQEDYLAWESSWMGDAHEIVLNERSLTEENIAQLQ